MKEKNILIPLSEYKRLLNSETKLDMLDAGGVDNWEWYGDSLNPDNEKSFSDWREINNKKAEELWENQNKKGDK